MRMREQTDRQFLTAKVFEVFEDFLLCSDTFLHYKVSYSYSIPFLSAKFMFWNLQERFGRRSKKISSC
jgi:hypothetical protein